MLFALIIRFIVLSRCSLWSFSSFHSSFCFILHKSKVSTLLMVQQKHLLLPKHSLHAHNSSEKSNSNPGKQQNETQLISAVPEGTPELPRTRHKPLVGPSAVDQTQCVLCQSNPNRHPCQHGTSKTGLLSKGLEKAAPPMAAWTWRFQL